MPAFHDPAAGAAEAQQALRGLAHATRTINTMAWLIGVLATRV